jgi:hypothetical protein
MSKHQAFRERPATDAESAACHIAVGDRVKLTGNFLRDTGQQVGGEGQSTWTVLKLERWGSGSIFAVVDERSYSPTEDYRRINAANLCRATDTFRLGAR